MEGARDFTDKAKEQASEYAEKAKGQVLNFADRAQQVAQGMRERVPGGRKPEGEGEESEQEGLIEQVKRGTDEAKDVGRELAEVAAELGALMKQEVQLAKAEVGQQVGKAVQSIVWAASAASLAMLMSVFLFVGIMLLLGEVFALWIAAIITTGILLVLALIAGLIAYQQSKRVRLAPRQTMESVKEDLEWARNQMTSSSR